MPKNIKYLPENFRANFFKDTDDKKPTGEISLDKEFVKIDTPIEIDNSKYIKKTKADTQTIVEVDPLTKTKSFSTNKEIEVLQSSIAVRPNIFGDSKTISEEVKPWDKTNTALTFRGTQTKKDEKPSLELSMDDVEKKQIDGFSSSLNDANGYKDATVSNNIKIDSNFLRIKSEFKAEKNNEYIKDDKILILIGSKEYEEKVGSDETHTNDLLQLKLDRTVEVIAGTSDYKRTMDDSKLQMEIFLYGLLPYLTTSVLSRSYSNIKNLIEQGEGAIVGAVTSLATSAFAKLEDAKYYTVGEFVRLAAISYVLYQTILPRGITVKKLTKKAFGYDTEEFNGKVDLYFGQEQKEKIDEMWKEINLYFELEFQSKRKGLNDEDHIEVMILQDKNAIIYAGGEASETRLFNFEDYQPIHYRGTGSQAAAPFYKRYFNTYELNTLVKNDFNDKIGKQHPDGITGRFSLSSSQATPALLKIINKGVMSEVKRTPGGVGTVKEVNITSIPIRNKFTDIDNTVLTEKVKGTLYNLGYIRVMPFNTTYKGFDIPLQLNPTINEGGVQAKYVSSSFIARVGDLQTYINTSSLNSVSLTTSYMVLTDGNNIDRKSFIYNGWEDYYDYSFVNTIENMYRSLVYPAFKEEEGKKSFEYSKPPIIRVCVGGNYSNLLVYPKKISTGGVENEVPSVFRNFIVTAVTINKDINNTPSILVKDNVVDTLGFEVNLTLTEVSRNYLDILPNFADYYNNFEGVIGKFQAEVASKQSDFESGMKSSASNIRKQLKQGGKDNSDSSKIKERQIIGNIQNDNTEEVVVDDSGKKQRRKGELEAK